MRRFFAAIAARPQDENGEGGAYEISRGIRYAAKHGRRPKNDFGTSLFACSAGRMVRWAKAQQDVALLLSRLAILPELSGVRLVTSSRGDDGAISFSINAAVRHEAATP